MMATRICERCGDSQESQLSVGVLVRVNSSKLVAMLVCQACPSAEVAGHVNKPHNYILTDEELAHATKTRPERERGPYIWGTPENPAECMGTSLLNAPLSAEVSAWSFIGKAQFVSHKAFCTKQ